MAICTEAKAVVRKLLFKISVLKNFAIFSEKRLQHRCFPVNIAKLLRTAFLTPPEAAFAETYPVLPQTFKIENFAVIMSC